MVRFEHANLVVTDIAATLDFIQTAFPKWVVRGEGKMNWKGKPRYWLHVGDDTTYITLNDNGEGDNRELAGHQPGLAHLGFEVDDVKGIVARLEAKGYVIDIDGGDHPFRKTVYFVDPQGFQFEFIQYFSDNPAERNLYDAP
ncbi:VOC family protein [Kiloniella sp.]|uniref:VOC family protein n=1 Tax=Kiloniella sp. TaxID=1938587 RepID=UPI003B02A36E